MFASRQQALFFDKAIEIRRCHGPGIALVFDKGMHDGNRAGFVAFDQFDAAEQRRRIGKTRDLGQKPAHFDFGIDAGFELSIDLDDIVTVYQRRAVGLFGFDGADLLGLSDRFVRELAGRPELQARVLFFNRQGVAEVAQQKRDENLVGRNIQQGAFPRALAYRSKGAGIIALAIEPHPFDPHRQYVTRRRAALHRFKKSEPGPVVANIAERDRRDQRRLNFLGRTLGIPAGSCQMSRQNVMFEYAAGAGQRHPCRAHRHHQGLEFRNHGWCDVLGFVAFSKLEPVKSVGRQHDHVGQFADRRKVGTAEHFLGNAVLPCRQVKFGGLRGTRQVGDAKDHFVAILPDIGQHGAIDRADKRHGAAAERQRGLAHRDQPLGCTQQRRQAA